jgi:hypothetical protein
MRGHALRLDVVLAGGPEIGMAQEVGGDADLLGSRVDQLGHGAVPEQMRPDGLAEALLGAPPDLSLALAVDPQVARRAVIFPAGRCN